ncbi:MAG: type II/IV secretion system protein [Planctomycetaceae bacterium]|nr:type II/IV secretion system protein [Planctomycetaceae bacterium]
MTSPLEQSFGQSLARLNPRDERYVAEVVDLILSSARAAGASDVHLVPDRSGLQMDWRIDGVLQPVVHLEAIAPNVVARLKVLAQLLTYRTDVPQEGRILERQGEQVPPRTAAAMADPERTTAETKMHPQAVEMRLSTFPTLYGEKAVVRLFVGSGRYCRLDDLGLPAHIATDWRQLLAATNGVLLISGPAGSGKTTTLYASLREILETSPERRSVVSLEDPIEAEVPGVAQSQVNAAAGFDYGCGLRSILRQDPEVIMVGEIRDRETAETVFQASLSGHLVLTSFHAGSSAEALSRLSDLGVEPYLLRSGLLGILSQRLQRRLCPCAIACDDRTQALGLPVSSFRIPTGCKSCGGTGYSGRLLAAELLHPAAGPVARAILNRADAAEIERQAIEAGLITLFAQSCRAVELGDTSPAEVRRVFGVQEGRGRKSPETFVAP